MPVCAPGESVVASTPSFRRSRAALYRWTATLGAGALTVWVFYRFSIVCEKAFALPLWFDDAYMFARYAEHVKQGLGIAWNPDGIPVYGLTSQAWLAVVVLLSYLPLNASQVLVLGSVGAWIAALVIMAAALMTQAAWPLLRNPAIAIAVIAIPLLRSPAFVSNATTGMDTMLSLAANATLAWVLYRVLVKTSYRNAVVCGAACFACVTVRPDNGVCVLGLMIGAFAALWRSDRTRHAWAVVATAATLVGGFALFCKVYFGHLLPLSVYMKRSGAYVGYTNFWNPTEYLLTFAGVISVYLVVLLFTFDRRNARIFLMYWLPVLVTFAGFHRANQIMGFSARYYIPFLPFIVLPILWTAEAPSMRGKAIYQRRYLVERLCIVLLAAVCWPDTWVSESVIAYSVKVHQRSAVALPKLVSRSEEKLPALDWHEQLKRLSDDVVAKLPAGTVVAASEVGYLGMRAPSVYVIDEVGLNDPYIAMHGFSAEYLLDRQPAFIWLPHTDYTGVRSDLLSNPRLLAEYTLVRDAFEYGVAVRKGSPQEKQIMGLLRTLFATMYPGRQMDDFVVQSVISSAPRETPTLAGQ